MVQDYIIQYATQWTVQKGDLSSSIEVTASASVSEPPRDMNFPQFSGDIFLVVTLQQLHLCGPLYLALPPCHPSFMPTYKASRLWSGVVVNMLASINKVNQRQARLVLMWVAVTGVGHLSRYVTSQPGQLNLANPSWEAQSVPAKGQ